MLDLCSENVPVIYVVVLHIIIDYQMRCILTYAAGIGVNCIWAVMVFIERVYCARSFFVTIRLIMKRELIFLS